MINTFKSEARRKEVLLSELLEFRFTLKFEMFVRESDLQRLGDGAKHKKQKLSIKVLLKKQTF